MEPLIAVAVALEPDPDTGQDNRDARAPGSMVARPRYPRDDLATRHRHGISSLLADRDDLRGVHAFADVVEESVRWSA